MPDFKVWINDGRVTVKVANGGEASAGTKRSSTQAYVDSSVDGEARAPCSSSSAPSDANQDSCLHQANKRAKLSDDGPRKLEQPKSVRCRTCQMRDIECKSGGRSDGAEACCEACQDSEGGCTGGPPENWETYEDKTDHRLKVVVSELETARDDSRQLDRRLASLKDEYKTKMDRFEAELKSLKESVNEKDKVIGNLEKGYGMLQNLLNKGLQDLRAESQQRFATLTNANTQPFNWATPHFWPGARPTNPVSQVGPFYTTSFSGSAPPVNNPLPAHTRGGPAPLPQSKVVGTSANNNSQC